MKHLLNSDYQSMIELVGEFHSCQDPHRLRERVAGGVMTLIGGEYASFEHFAPTVPRAWAVGANGYAYENWVLSEFAKYASEHPAIIRYQETGDVSAIKISDFVDAKTWHRTNLYQRIHRVLGIEDQLGISLGPPDEEFYSVVLSRGRRNFTERERAIMNYLRPHIASAHNHAMAMERLLEAHRNNEEAQQWLSQSAILINGKGQVRHSPRVARRWLSEFFQTGYREDNLPEQLKQWLQASLEKFHSKKKFPTTPLLPLIQGTNSHRLILRFRADSENGKYAVVLEKQTIPNQALMKRLGLTRRQLEVLVEVEKGKSNEDIAAALFISPQTVRTHLQNIFQILAVKNRTAAVSRLRRGSD